MGLRPFARQTAQFGDLKVSGHVVKVMVVDDYEIVRFGIRHLLSSMRRYHVIAEASDGAEAIVLAKQTKPDVVILDHSLPEQDAMEVASELRVHAPRIKILLFSSGNMISEVSKAIEAGINGLVLKSQKEEFLIKALEVVADGGRYFLPALGQGQADTRAIAPLSPREREVVRLLAEGNEYLRIANTLGVTKKTVECFRTNAMEKLRMSNTTELVLYAVKSGLVSA